MATAVMKDSKKANAKTNVQANAQTDLGSLLGRMYSFNNSLKLYHWHVSGKGSYAQHMALDQALETLADVMDRLVETTYSLKGDIQITIPQTDTPSNIVAHVEGCYDYVESQRNLFSEDFSGSIVDDYQEGLQQLLYRLKRLQ